MRSLVILCTWLDVASAFYSIYYYSTSSNVIMNAGSVFTDAPHSNQVADIYTRMSGLTPLLHEGKLGLPFPPLFFLWHQVDTLLGPPGNRLRALAVDAYAELFASAKLLALGCALPGGAWHRRAMGDIAKWWLVWRSGSLSFGW